MLYDISYTNLTLYGAALPSYKSPTKQGDDSRVINGDDPSKQAEIDKLFDETNRRR